MITIILLLFLTMFSAFEETQQLIQRGSWKKKDYRIPIWETRWDGKWKLFDSHHIAFGLFALTMFTFVYFVNIKTLWLIPVYWVVFFYLRNLWMHLLFKRKSIWWYLIPFYGYIKRL